MRDLSASEFDVKFLGCYIKLTQFEIINFFGHWFKRSVELKAEFQIKIKMKPDSPKIIEESIDSNSHSD
jgi:hypothetical protein